MPVDDPASPELRDYVGLTDVVARRLSEPAGGLYIAESSKVILRALEAGHEPRSVLLQEKWLEELEPAARAATTSRCISAPPSCCTRSPGS